MNKLIGFRFISLASVFLLLVVWCAVPPFTQSTEIQTIQGKEIQITKDSKDQENPAISGDLIVWQDFRNGNWDIYMYDLVTKKESQITSHPADQINPAISGNVIVWEDYSKSDKRPNICMLDLAKNKIELVDSTPASQKYPAVSGDRIIWVEIKKVGSFEYKDEFCVYNLDNSEKSVIFSFQHYLLLFSLLTLEPEEEFDPPAISGEWAVISGNWIIPYWESVVSHNVVLIFNVVTKEKISLGRGCLASISGDKVVWFGENPDSNYDLKVYDLVSKTTTIIFPPHKKCGIDIPKISGNWVVYTDKRDDRKRIYLYDMANKKETKINFHPSKNPAISGNRIVWADYRNKNWDIYMYNLAKKE